MVMTNRMGNQERYLEYELIDYKDVANATYITFNNLEGSIVDEWLIEAVMNLPTEVGNMNMFYNNDFSTTNKKQSNHWFASIPTHSCGFDLSNVGITFAEHNNAGGVSSHTRAQIHQMYGGRRCTLVDTWRKEGSLRLTNRFVAWEDSGLSEITRIDIMRSTLGLFSGKFWLYAKYSNKGY